MNGFTAFIIFLATLYSAAAKERINGILYDHSARQIRLYSPEIMRSNNFPNKTPHDLVQTWRWVGMQRPGEHTAIKVVCNQILIPKLPGQSNCGNYKLIADEGNNKQEFCGDIGQLNYLSKTNDVTFELKSGPNGGSLVDCTAQAVLLAADGKEISTTTATPTRPSPVIPDVEITTSHPVGPTRPTFWYLESEEIDSSEHGDEGGNKSTTCPCGWANKGSASARIVNGSETARNEFPFIAGLTYRESRGRYCAASILTRYHAMTAGHCVDGRDAEDLSILVGLHNTYEDKGGPFDEVNVEKYIKHEGYTKGIWKHDIALLVLEREIQFSQFVGPVCLPTSSPKLNLERQYVKIIGWGAMEWEGYQSPVLRKVDVRVVYMNECKWMYPYIEAEVPTQMCTYAKQKSSCQGDSGGPVVWLDPETNRYTQIGIVSFAKKCADISPSVQTRVQYYLDWIQRNIKASKRPNENICTKVY